MVDFVPRLKAANITSNFKDLNTVLAKHFILNI